ncbi:MAG TPA: hypothetical protein VE826_07930 [Dongiaceae bacterium]|nr:hypothetical protein [Dongiaceae bacterium]
MNAEREKLSVDMESLFGDIPAAVVGGVATRAYSPERKTHDVDVLVDHARYGEALHRLERLGWGKIRDLFFTAGLLGLYGSAWVKDGQKLDVLATDQPWAGEALSEKSYDQTGLRVIALPYLVMMKIDSARGIDQGDLTRMLGLLDDAGVECVVDVVRRHYGDPHGAEDVRQYAMLGKLEYWTPDAEP